MCFTMGDTRDTHFMYAINMKPMGYMWNVTEVCLVQPNLGVLVA